MSMNLFAGWPRWRFMNYWKGLRFVDYFRVVNYWKPGIVEDFWSFCLFNFYVSGEFIGVTILNFSLEYKRQHPVKTDPAVPVQPGIWRVAYTPAHGSTCDLEHRCAVCGGPAIDPGHGTRGDTWKPEGLANCPDDFLVRCAHCQLMGKKLDGQILASTISTERNDYRELIAFFRKHGVPIVYEIM